MFAVLGRCKKLRTKHKLPKMFFSSAELNVVGKVTHPLAVGPFEDDCPFPKMDMDSFPGR